MYTYNNILLCKKKKNNIYYDKKFKVSPRVSLVNKKNLIVAIFSKTLQYDFSICLKEKRKKTIQKQKKNVKPF